MRRDRIPSDADLQRMPAGERGPRLRALAAFYGERLAVAEARASYSRQQSNITSHRRTLAKIEHAINAVDDPKRYRRALQFDIHLSQYK